ncbi:MULTISPECIES: DUF349 domain-containing protein [Thiorhodovibrio]|uniref:DUF349 domain-containing protein n=1 Tax=Thiorhodovibrio TaxID=61593 RepID=UPI00191494B0|nr:MULTISPECIES: DUF349 domain-containing protein [Thiorhodovibrio]MBK5969958.1 hypothetical protein [Thiorhodovibrio winogradskyi]WPL12881.1 hypothetical protein Thiosp_02661 [Thiorhodovibrio litoralis]
MIFKRLFRKAPSPAAPDPRALAEAALNDADPAAQREACRRIDDLSVLRQVAEQSSDAGTRDLAAARYRHILCRLESGAARLDQAIAEIPTLTDPDQLGEIAREARAPELRLAAIAQLPADAPALARCAVEDALPGHRQQAVERIRERHLLEQVVRQIGKRDTKVYRFAREKLRSLAEQEERPRLARQRHDELCGQLERLGRFKNWTQDRARLTLIDRQWSEIQADLEPTQRDHFQALRETFIAEFDRHAQAKATMHAAQQTATADMARRQELIRRLQTLEHETDPHRLDAELASIGDAWSDLDGEQSLDPSNEAESTSTDHDAPAADHALEAMRHAGQQALARALARQRQLRNQDTEDKNAFVEQNHQRELQTQLLSDAENLLEASSGPIDYQSARKLQKQLKSLQNTDKAPADAERSRIASLLETLDRRICKQRLHAERKLEAAPEQLHQLAAHLDAGELRKAEPLHQKIGAALDQARAADLPRSEINKLDKQLNHHQAKLRELQRWRRWSADQGRESLCHEAETLLARAEADTADAELDTLAARLNHLRRDWRRIDQSGTPAGESYWQRFKQATDQVAARCEPYFQARAEHQRASREARRMLCEKLEHFLAAVDWDSVDWKAMVRAEREMRQAWNALDQPEAGGRGGLEGRFRRGLAQVDKALKEERASNQAHKRHLIERMRELAEMEDLDAAIAQAKSAQKQWHTTVSGRKQEENALWREFRTASDAVFARRHQERAARSQEFQDNLARSEALCDQAEALVGRDKIQAATLSEDLQQLTQQWRDSLALPLPRQDKKRLEQRWDNAEQQARQLLRTLRDQADWDALEGLRQKSDFLSRTAGAILADSSAASEQQLRAQWSQLDESDHESHDESVDNGSPPNRHKSRQARADQHRSLQQRFEALLHALQNPKARDQMIEQCESARHEREALCLRLEILAHLDSPPELTARRMELQVERLQEKLGDGDNQADPLAQSRPLLIDWYLNAPAANDQQLQARFERIEAALKPGASAAQTPPAP